MPIVSHICVVTILLVSSLGTIKASTRPRVLQFLPPPGAGKGFPIPIYPEGKGKGSIPVYPEGKGKGSIPVYPDGKGKGTIPMYPDGKGKGTIPIYPDGKGKGTIPIYPDGKGKGSIPVYPDGKGKGYVPGPQYPEYGKGKGKGYYPSKALKGASKAKGGCYVRDPWGHYYPCVPMPTHAGPPRPSFTFAPISRPDNGLDTEIPTEEPGDIPTVEPVEVPTQEPTVEPQMITTSPTASPTVTPTTGNAVVTPSPTSSPVQIQTPAPTAPGSTAAPTLSRSLPPVASIPTASPRPSGGEETSPPTSPLVPSESPISQPVSGVTSPPTSTQAPSGASTTVEPSVTPSPTSGENILTPTPTSAAPSPSNGVLPTAAPSSFGDNPTSSPTATGAPSSTAAPSGSGGATSAPTSVSTSSPTASAAPSSLNGVLTEAPTSLSTPAPTSAGGTPQPTASMAPSDIETFSPSGLVPDTAVPSGAPSGAILRSTSAVDATPFAVEYALTGEGEITEEHIDEAAGATATFLQNYLTDVYDQYNRIELQEVVVVKIGDTGVDRPTRIGYDLVTVFDNDSRTIPDSEDINTLVSQALSAPDYESLIEELGTLTEDNPFSSTTSVTYDTMNVPQDAEPDSFLVPLIVSIAATFGVLVLSVSIVTTLRRRKVVRSVKEAQEVATDAPTYDCYSDSGNVGESSDVADNSTIEEFHEEGGTLPYATSEPNNSLFGRL